MPACPTTDRAKRKPGRVALFAAALGVTWAFAGCYYDVRDNLYGPAVDCDTLATVSFSGDIVPLLDLHCNSGSCHGGGTNPNLTTHAGVAQSATEGSLLTRIRKPAEDPLVMPKNGTPLPECDLRLFEQWVAEGATNN